MSNPFVHGVELRTTDPESARIFFQKLFEWKFDHYPEMNYFKFAMAGSGGGIMKNPDPNSPTQWVPYFPVDNIAKATQKALELGGKVITDVTEIPGHGWFSVILDPTGASFGLWKGAKRD